MPCRNPCHHAFAVLTTPNSTRRSCCVTAVPENSHHSSPQFAHLRLNSTSFQLQAHGAGSDANGTMPRGQDRTSATPKPKPFNLNHQTSQCISSRSFRQSAAARAKRHAPHTPTPPMRKSPNAVLTIDKFASQGSIV